MSQGIIQINDVYKSFGKQAVLRGLTWSVQPGQVIGLLGRNGAGKSTLMECLLGLREVDAGSAHIFGNAAGHFSEATRARIGYVPQQSELFEWLTPVQMLGYFRAFYPRWNKEKVEGLLSRWQIDRNKTIAKLSGGEKQRLSIIRALAHEPELLILDEPVASLDPAARRDFLRELIDSVIERHTTVVFSTHILSDLERVAVEVAFLREGKIALQSGLDELLESTRRISGPPAALEKIELITQVLRSHKTTKHGNLIARLSDEQLISLSHDTTITVEKMGLEDLFIEVTQ